MEGWEEIRKFQSSEKEETRTHSLCYWGCFYGRRLQFFKFFLSLNNKNKRSLSPKRDRLGACCLTILNYINFKCFKGTMRPRHIYVCGFKGGRLWDERWTFMGWKMMKGGRLWDERWTFMG